MDSFQEFNVDNLISLAKLYPSDFDSMESRELNTRFVFILLACEKMIDLSTFKQLLSYLKNDKDKKTSYLSFGLSTFEASTCIARCYCYSQEDLLSHESCENKFAQPHW